jgi:hypothetical protein
MDKLKDFIDRHREQFDNVALPKGHLQRFERKLNGRNRRPARYILPIGVAIAAAACILAVLFVHPNNNGANPGNFFICEADEEMNELRNYYRMRVYDLEEQLRSLHQAHPSPETLAIIQDSEDVAQSIQSFEENLLPTLPCSHSGLNVINRQYAGSLESLGAMLEQMEAITNRE